jgi:hypothetical protein
LIQFAGRRRHACTSALSNHVRVVDLNASDGAPPTNDQGVLANLPRTRPQRSTPRRTASRDNDRAAGPAPAGARARGSAASAKRRARAGSATRAKATSRRQQAAPVQGFECESEAATGSVQPPGAVELLASAAEVVSELTKAGVSRSERLLKDLVSRLPRA